MLSKDEKLVRMANQMADFFRSYPEKEAAAGIHQHIITFWTPKMVAELEACLPAMGARADILVHKAMRGDAPQGESPIRAATRNPAEIGAGASDAG